MIRSLVLAVSLCGVAAPAFAQIAEIPPSANASLTIERSLTIAAVQPMSFNPVSTSTGVVVTTQSGTAIIRVSGDPGRVYRVNLPAEIVASPGDRPVDVLTVISDNSGDITSNLTARMNAEGSDRLQITGLLSQPSGIALTNVSAAVPIGVDYE